MRFLSVSEITSQIKTTLTAHFECVYVEGEISNLTKHQSGHCYFSLKDNNASIKCVLFRGNNAAKILENNIQVQIEGNLSVYENRGEYQIICNNINKAGLGDLAVRFEKLKEKLKEKGYFDRTKKKKIPTFPKKIALLTSKSGAALQDIKFVANKRWGLTNFILIDTLVQGNEAKNIIAKNIAFADTQGFDIIVLARGGGSLEDLWAFNEEIVADEIYRAQTPIVSAIGHETDVVLSDFVADLRAPTPSACMEMILPDKNECKIQLNEVKNALNRAQAQNLAIQKSKLDTLKEHLETFRFDYNALHNELCELHERINGAFVSFRQFKEIAITSLAKNIRLAFANQCPRKKQQILSLATHLDSTLLHFIHIKHNEMITQSALDEIFMQYLTKKALIFKHTKELLKAKKPSAPQGFVQITQNGKIISLKATLSGDEVELSDGEISKIALIK